MILPKEYTTTNHPVVPLQGKEKRRKVNYEHIMLKNDFRID